MKLWIARSQDSSLALFRKKKPKLFFEEGVGQYWVGSSLWLDSNDYPEVTFENSPMEVELVIKKEQAWRHKGNSLYANTTAKIIKLKDNDN